MIFYSVLSYIKLRVLINSLYALNNTHFANEHYFTSLILNLPVNINSCHY